MYIQGLSPVSELVLWKFGAGGEGTAKNRTVLATPLRQAGATVCLCRTGCSRSAVGQFLQGSGLLAPAAGSWACCAGKEKQEEGTGRDRSCDRTAWTGVMHEANRMRRQRLGG